MGSLLCIGELTEAIHELRRHLDSIRAEIAALLDDQQREATAAILSATQSLGTCIATSRPTCSAYSAARAAPERRTAGPLRLGSRRCRPAARGSCRRCARSLLEPLAVQSSGIAA